MEGDIQEMEQGLSAVGYYRLSAYTHPFRQRDAAGELLPAFVPGTQWQLVWAHYRFDRNLRFVLLDAIERIEVFLRSKLAYYHTEKSGPFAYSSPQYFPGWIDYQSVLDKTKARRKVDKRGAQKMTDTDYVDHFFSKYGDQHDYLPLWMAMGVFDFGFLEHFFNNSPRDIQKKIAAELDLQSKTLATWLLAIRELRNMCAHHARVWNKVFNHRLTFPSNAVWTLAYDESAHCWRKNAQQKAPHPDSVAYQTSNLAGRLFICRYLLRKIAPASQWKERVEKLFSDFEKQGVLICKTGLPVHWMQHPLWK